MTRYRVSVDIGGTFTNIVFLGEQGERLTKKVSSTVDNYATAIVDGLTELTREHNLEAPEIVEFLHGTMVASNAILELLLDDGVQAIADWLIHSYHNPTHQQLVKRVAPDVTLCISSEVLPEIKEYEQTSTTVISAYARPIVERYLSTLTADLARIGVDAPLLLIAIEWRPDHRQGCRRDPHEHHRKRAGGGCCWGPGADPADRHRKRDLVRHGRHRGQGFVDRKWRAQPRPPNTRSAAAS
jgi:N-methylhydantoinase A/oxoprolinase/acetone carboxylase beta subunit